MRKILLLLTLLFTVVVGQSTTVTIQGTVSSALKDSMPAKGIIVKLYVNSGSDPVAVDTTDSAGAYTLVYDNATLGDKYSIQAIDYCDSVYTQDVSYDGDSDLIVNFFVSCPCSHMMKITGKVMDESGKPFGLSSITLRFNSFDSLPFDQITTNADGSFQAVYCYDSTVDKSIILSISDAASVVYNRTVNLPETAGYYTQNVNFEVTNGWQNMIAVEGTVKNDTMSFPNTGIFITYKKDRYKKIFVKADDKGHYQALVPMSFYPTDTLVIGCYDAQQLPIVNEFPVDTSKSYIFDDINVNGLNVPPLVMYTISGTAYDNNSNPASYLPVSGVFRNLSVLQTQSITDEQGNFEFYLFGPSLGDDDTVDVSVGDCDAGNASAIVPFEPGEFENNVEISGVECAPRFVNNQIEIRGVVKDSSGNPVSGLPVSLSLVYGQNIDQVSTGDSGEFTIYFPVPDDTTLFKVKLNDYCTVLDTTLLFDFNDSIYNLNFVVPCPKELTLTLQGQVYGTTDKDKILISGARVKAYELNDPQHYLQTIANYQGYYKFVTNKIPQPGDTIVVVAQDAAANKDSSMFVFYPSKVNYTVDISSTVFTEPFKDYDTLVTISGKVLDKDSLPAPNVLITAYYQGTESEPTADIEKGEMQDGFVHTVTNNNGEFTIHLPLSYNNDSVIVDIMDNCYNYYEKSVYFDFSQFKFDMPPFIIDCVPTYDSIQQPGITISMNQNWQKFNQFDFSAALYKPELLQEPVAYYVWHIGADTVVTVDPFLHYNFGQVDTCVNVYVQAAFNNINTLLTSKPMRVCVKNPFGETKTQGYADFTVEVVDSTGLRFNFTPYLEPEDSSKIISVIWDFGDGNTQTLDTNFDTVVTHTYVKPGKYLVKLMAEFQDTVTAKQYKAIWEEPVWTGSDIWYPDSCAAAFYVETDSADPMTLHFEDISYPGKYAKILSYYWDFGDSSTAVVPSPTHTFSQEGEYNVYMEIVTSAGCYDKFSVKVQPGKQIEPIFFYPDTVGGTKAIAVKFHNISKNTSDDDDWAWDFGESKGFVQLKGDTIIHYYQDTGTYQVTLKQLSTNAALTMTIHVVSNDQVIPIDGIFLPADITSSAQKVDFNLLKVYPNPVKDLLQISLPDNAKRLSLSIYNASGRLIRKAYVSGSNIVRLNVRDLPVGTYFIKATYGDKVAISKFIKQ